KHFAYLLEILSSFAFRHAEAFRTFAGSALQRCVFLRKSAFHLCWQCSPSSHFATQLLQTCWKCFYHRIIRRKTASHFCWKCFPLAHFTMEERFALAGDARENLRFQPRLVESRTAKPRKSLPC